MSTGVQGVEYGGTIIFFPSNKALVKVSLGVRPFVSDTASTDAVKRWIDASLKTFDLSLSKTSPEGNVLGATSDQGKQAKMLFKSAR